MSNHNDPSDKKKWSALLSDKLLSSSVKGVFSITGVDLLIVTDDKVKLWLIDNLKYVERKLRWIIPLGILIPIALTFCTCSFNVTALGVPGANWEAFFFILGLIAIIWFIYEVIWIIIMVYRKKALTIDKMVHRLKEESIEPSFALDSDYSVFKMEPT